MPTITEEQLAENRRLEVKLRHRGHDPVMEDRLVISRHDGRDVTELPPRVEACVTSFCIPDCPGCRRVVLDGGRDPRSSSARGAAREEAPMTDDVDEYIKKGRRRALRWKMAGSGFSIAGIFLCVVALMFVECNGCKVGDGRALEAIEADGMTHIKLGGTDPWACEENEGSRHFEATNPLGAHVEGTVCCGLTGCGKGCTIRWGR